MEHSKDILGEDLWNELCEKRDRFLQALSLLEAAQEFEEAAGGEEPPVLSTRTMFRSGLLTIMSPDAADIPDKYRR